MLFHISPFINYSKLVSPETERLPKPVDFNIKDKAFRELCRSVFKVISFANQLRPSKFSLKVEMGFAKDEDHEKWEKEANIISNIKKASLQLGRLFVDYRRSAESWETHFVRDSEKIADLVTVLRVGSRLLAEESYDLTVMRFRSSIKELDQQTRSHLEVLK